MLSNRGKKGGAVVQKKLHSRGQGEGEYTHFQEQNTVGEKKKKNAMGNKATEGASGGMRQRAEFYIVGLGN